MPSIVFGLLGLTLFVRGAGIESLSLGNTVIAAALTMSLLILPIIIVSSQEAIRAVPNSVRASYGLGGNKWQTIRKSGFTRCFTWYFNGIYLSLSRALGETAPLILIGIPTIFLAVPSGLFSMFTALPTQIYTWAKMPQAEFKTWLQQVLSYYLLSYY